MYYKGVRTAECSQGLTLSRRVLNLRIIYVDYSILRNLDVLAVEAEKAVHVDHKREYALTIFVIECHLASFQFFP